jgi:hypothetical protein
MLFPRAASVAALTVAIEGIAARQAGETRWETLARATRELQARGRMLAPDGMEPDGTPSKT